MEFEFDKEMDSLLRQTAQRERTISQEFNAHIDADEISLFAENTLTKKAQMRVTEHLADCAKCRKILSNVIVLNSEEASEIVHTEKPEIAVAETSIPWYRKLFIFPQLAYTMGGLTVLLAGLIGYVTLQSYNEPKNSSIAQMEKTVERPRGAGGADSDGDTVTVDTYSANTASNAALPPAAASNAAATTANTAMSVAGKSNVPMSAVNSNTVAAAAPKKEQASIETLATPSAVAETADIVTNERDAENKEAKTEPAGNAGRAAQQDYSRNSIVQNQTTIMPDSRNVQTRRVQNLPSVTSAPATPQQSEPTEIRQTAKKAKSGDDKKDSPERNRNVGGKDFVYREGVWYDKSYKQQKTINVRRNSDDYKKLDSGLRSVADNLGGTIVIVWKSTAYRIH